MERNGGEEVTLGDVLATPKAQAQLRELRPELDVTEVIAPLLGGKIRRLSDGSPYFWTESQGLRLVFCVRHPDFRGTYTEYDGKFALVTVKEAWRRN